MFKFPRILISRRWKWPRVLIALMVIEVAGTVAALALFGIAQPDLFRTKLWQVGADHGWNSSPKDKLYAYANYRPIPKTPFIWSKTYVFSLSVFWKIFHWEFKIWKWMKTNG